MTVLGFAAKTGFGPLVRFMERRIVRDDHRQAGAILAQGALASEDR